LIARQIPYSTPRVSGVTYKDAAMMFWFARKSKILDDVSKRRTIGPLECTHLPKQIPDVMLIPCAVAQQIHRLVITDTCAGALSMSIQLPLADHLTQRR
jgi:hypothetical protein